MTILRNTRNYRTSLEKLLSTLQVAVKKCKERPTIEGRRPGDFRGIGPLPTGLLARPRTGG